MASRNQNRPPRSPSNKKGVAEEVPSDKRRRIGAERMERQGTSGMGRLPFVSLNKGSDVNATNDVCSAEATNCSTVEFTKEYVEVLLNEKIKKGNPYDTKLKLCVRGLFEEKEQFQSALESAEKKCTETEAEMKNKIDESNEIISDLRKSNSSLEVRIAKEESDKLQAIECHRKEKDAKSAAEKMQASLSAELDKVRQEKSVAEKKENSKQEECKRSQVYNMSLQQYNSSLQSDLESTNQSHERLKMEKTTVIETLRIVRVHNKALQDQLESVKASQEETTKKNEVLVNELKCLREELKRIRSGRDGQLEKVQALTGEVECYKKETGDSFAQLDNLTLVTRALEEKCSSLMEQIQILQQQLTPEKEKLKMADLSASETRTCFEEQKRIISELQDRLADKESRVIEGEKLRKKLHNTILIIILHSYSYITFSFASYQ